MLLFLVSRWTFAMKLDFRIDHCCFGVKKEARELRDYERPKSKELGLQPED